MRKILAVIVAFAMMTLGFIFSGSQNAFAAGVSCSNGFLTDTTVSSISVPAGRGCALYNVHVRGGVIVAQGAQFIACDSGIDGSITANGAFINVDPMSVVGGSVSDNRPTPPASENELDFCESEYLPSGPYAFSMVLCAWQIGGSVTVTNAANTPFTVAQIGGCSDFLTNGNGPALVHTSNVPSFQPYINGPVLLAGNHQLMVVLDEQIHGSLSCTNNNPTPFWAFVTASNGIHGCQELP